MNDRKRESVAPENAASPGLSDTPTQDRGAPRRVLSLHRVATRAVAYLAAYVLVGVLIVLTQPASGPAAWYPPIAIGMALLLRHGLRYAPVVFLADLTVSIIQYQSGSLVALVIAANTTLEAASAAWLLRVAGFRVPLKRETDFLLLAVLAAGVATLVGATVGSVALQWESPDPAFEFLPQWRTWWIGDATGVVVFLPALLLMVRPSVRWFQCSARAIPRRRLLEFAALIVLGAALCVWIFSPSRTPSAHRIGYEMLAFLPVVWAAVRFGPRTTSVVIVATNLAAWLFNRTRLVADAGVADGVGVESLQVFMLGLSLGGLTLAIALEGQRRARAMLAAHRDRLAVIVEARTAALSEALAAAERANATKSEFLANVSHELRTPMHAIRSFAGFGMAQADHAERDKLRGFFAKIDLSSRRLLALLNDLLDLSKLEAGHVRLDLSQTDVAALGQQVCDELASVASGRQVSIDLEVRTPDTEADVDALRIQQVMTNVVSNAVKFSEAGGRVVLVITADDAADAPRTGGLRIEVIDEGVGVPPSELESIFDKFVQSSKTRTGAGGTGLGLAICREIVRAHGGSIHAEPNQPKGTRIVVRLPRDPVICDVAA